MKPSRLSVVKKAKSDENHPLPSHSRPRQDGRTLRRSSGVEVDLNMNNGLVKVHMDDSKQLTSTAASDGQVWGLHLPLMIPVQRSGPHGRRRQRGGGPEQEHEDANV